jgi:hypothetical protein
VISHPTQYGANFLGTFVEGGRDTKCTTAQYLLNVPEPSVAVINSNLDGGDLNQARLGSVAALRHLHAFPDHQVFGTAVPTDQPNVFDLTLDGAPPGQYIIAALGPLVDGACGPPVTLRPGPCNAGSFPPLPPTGHQVQTLL